MNKNKELEIWTENIYVKLYKKYLKSRGLFILLNLTSIAMVSLMIILNLFAIKKNVFEDTKVYYVIIAIVSALIGLLTSVSSFMLFGKNRKVAKEQYESIKSELKDYKNGVDKYKTNQLNREQILIEEVHNIMDEVE